MKTVLVLLVLFLSACSAMPSMKYCEHVEYVRDGNRITLTAECQAPVGSPIPGI